MLQPECENYEADKAEPTVQADEAEPAAATEETAAAGSAERYFMFA